MRAVFTVLVVGLVAAFLVPGLGSAASGLRLRVEVTGNGSVTSKDQRISCPPTCETEYADQDAVTLDAVPGSTAESFEAWGGDCANYQSSTCVVEMTEDRDVTADFTGASPEPSATATAEPSATATSEPTASPSPSPTSSPSPTATAQPSPTATPGPSQSATRVAAQLVNRIARVRRVPPRPRALTIRAPRRFSCERRCLVSAVLRDRSGKRRTLARGSATTRAGGSPAVKLRFTRYGRSALLAGQRRARITVTVQMDELARRSRSLTVRVTD